MKNFRTIASRGVALLLAFAMAGPLFAALIHAEPGADGAFCGFSEHIHGPECVKQVWPCGQEADPDHQHVATCWFEEKQLICGLEEVVFHYHGDGNCVEGPVLNCQESHEHVATCYEYRCTRPAILGHTHTEFCYDPDGTLWCTEPEVVEHTHTDACRQTVVKNLCGKHVHDDSCGEPQTVGCGLEEHGHTESCFVEPVPVYTFTEGGVSVTGPLPEQTTLAVAPVDPSALPTLPGQLAFAYDITPMVEGNVYEVTKPVTVTIPVPDVPNGALVTVYHVTDGGPVVIKKYIYKGTGTVSFQADSFSVYYAMAEMVDVAPENIEFDISKGPVEIKDETYTGVLMGQSEATTGPHVPGNVYTVSQSDAGTATENTITVDVATETIQIHLNGVNIQTKTYEDKKDAGSWPCAFSAKVKDSAQVHVVLKDGTQNKLYSGRNRAGLEKTGGASYNGLLLLTCEAGYEAWKLNNDHGHTMGEDNRSACTADCGFIDARSGNAWKNTTSQQEYEAGAGIGSGGEGTKGSAVEGVVAGTNALVNLTIAGGNIHAMGARGLTKGDPSGGGAAIGTGSANSSSITGGTVNGLKITGGKFELWRTDNSAALIGGGYRSGYVNMSILGGTIITHDEVDSNHTTATKLIEVRAPGIGGGGGGLTSGSPAGATVNISGGYIETSSQYGAAIGAGAGGDEGNGSPGKVNISGGTIYATTTKGHSTKGQGAGAAIGTGGSLGTGHGGNATVTISGGTIYASSEKGADIGGGGTNSTKATAAGGVGTVTISGGTIEAMSGGIGGGRANAGIGGTAYVTIEGGNIKAATIGGGASISNNGGNAEITVNDGKIVTGSIGGGLTQNEAAYIGHAKAIITGGDIIGQFIMAKGAADPCSFDMSGGVLHDSNTLDDSVYVHLRKDGGAVYMDDPSGIVTISGGTIEDCQAQRGGAIYMTAGTLALSGDAKIQNCSATENGGAIWMGKDGENASTATISGGTIQNCTSQNGGAIYMTAGTLALSGDARIQDCSAAENGGAIWMGKDGEITGTANISGGTVQRCSAVNGGAIYMGGGTLTMTAGTITGNAASNNGGAVYLQQGTLTMSGGSISKNGILGETSTKNGGGIYMGGGMLTLSGVQADETTFVPAEIHDNEATETGGGIWLGGGELHLDGAKVTENYAGGRGGGAYVQDGLICMSSGAVDGNEAGSDGGGMYVSSASQAVVVDILSGSVSGNSSAGRGGALAIVGQDKKVTLTIGVNEAHFDAEGKSLRPFDHTHCHTVHDPHTENCTLTHVSCPQVSDNKAAGEGGAVFISGSTAEGLETELNIYCVTAAANDGTGEKSDFMKVEGGAVQVDSAKKAYGDTEITEKGDHCHGQAHIDNSLHIVGGQVDLYGDTENPSFGDSITVDIPESAGTEQWFRDHRYADPEEWFRVVYHADYTDAILGKVTTYIAYQFPTMTDSQPTVHKIKAAIFSREGYRIRGWIGRDQDVTDPDPDTEYEVASDWPLTQSLPALTNSTNTLHLYAVWDVYGYYIAFDPNVPTGESYGTDMETVFRGYEAEEALPKCTFARSGYRFTGWMDGIGRAYEDGQVVSRLTEQDLATVTLYAQWEKCNHVDHCTHTYSVTGGGTQLLRSCSCGGQDLYATIHVPNVVYDGNVHYTAGQAVTWDSEWPESDRFQVLFRKDSLAGESVKEPVNAGTYVCYINRECAGLYAAVTYQILKAPQPAPDPVSFAASGSTLTVSAPDSGERGTALRYKLVYQTTEGAKTLDWQDGNSFTLPENYTSYQVYAMYAGSDNYLPSPEGRSDDVYFYQDATGTKISIQCADGIDYTAAGNSVLGGFHIVTSPEAGWYLTYDFTVEILSQTGGDKKATVEPESEDTKWSSYVMKGIPTGATIVVSITGAKRSPVLEAKVMPGQQFGEVTDQLTTIVRDSSFTAWFSVEYYDGDVYAVPELTFNHALPEGTTLILTDGNYRYWHHTVDTPAGEISLTGFAPMGSDDPVLSGTSFAGQFVVDFSRCTDAPGQDLTVTLRADKMGETNAPEWQSLLEVKSILLKDVTFGLSVAAGTTEGGLTQILEYSYQPGADSASRWEGKGAALRLTPSPNTPLPPDATLHLVTARGASVHLPTGDSFLLPLERLPWGQNKVGTAAITLQSALLPKTAASYIFTAELLISPTGVSTSPEGYMTVKTLDDVTFSKGVTMEPALKVESNEKTTKADAIPYTVTVSGMERGAEITIYLQQKNELGTYMDTAQSYRWQYDGTDLEQSMSLALYKTAPGSYRLWAQAVYDGHILTEVPYYFLIVQ